MPRAKVRHGLINYTKTDEASGREYEDRAFRDMIVDLKPDEYDRLKELGAVIDPDEELDRPGTLRALPDTATDEEIINWATAATESEVHAACVDRPMLAARLEAAWEAVQERVEHYRSHMGGLIDAAKDGADEGSERLEAEREAAARSAVDGGPVVPTPGGISTVPGGIAPALSSTPGSGDAGGTQPPSGTVPGPEGTGDAARDEYFDEVVAQNRDAVLTYISDHPDEAAEILEAENRKAAVRNEQPRVSVVRAVEAAVGHAGT